MFTKEQTVETATATAVYAVLGFVVTWGYHGLVFRDPQLPLIPVVGAVFAGAVFIMDPLYSSGDSFRRRFKTWSRLSIAVSFLISLAGWFGAGLAALSLWSPGLLRPAVLSSLIAAPVGLGAGCLVIRFYEFTAGLNFFRRMNGQPPLNQNETS